MRQDFRKDMVIRQEHVRVWLQPIKTFSFRISMVLYFTRRYQTAWTCILKIEWPSLTLVKVKLLHLFSANGTTSGLLISCCETETFKLNVGFFFFLYGFCLCKFVFNYSRQTIQQTKVGLSLTYFPTYSGTMLWSWVLDTPTSWQKKKILSLSGTKITAPRYVLPSELIQLGSIEFCSNNHCPSLSLLVCSVSFGIHGTKTFHPAAAIR